MAEMPSSLKVGYRDYCLEVWKPSEAIASGRYAECDKMNGIIRVDHQFGPQKAAESLLHEVLHAAFDIAGIEDKGEEERVVTALSLALCQIWRDNPGFVAFISGNLSGRASECLPRQD